MGTMFYGDEATPIHIEDRALAHLRLVIATKLRRGESFTLSWRHPENEPRGRSTIWLHPSIPLRYVFDDPDPVELSRQWIENLNSSANSSGGIVLIPEDVETSMGPTGPPLPSQTGLEPPPNSESADVQLSNVQVEHLDVGKLTIAGDDGTPR